MRSNLFNRFLFSLAILFVINLALLSLSSSNCLALRVPIKVFEALPLNESGLDRTNDLVTVGIPLPQDSGISSINQLGLEGTNTGQFRVLARWPNGNIKWVLIDTLASVEANNYSIFYLTDSNQGNFPSGNLASEDNDYIYVNTGPSQFWIRKKNFNLLDKVVLNGIEVISPGESEGIVVKGKRYNDNDYSIFSSILGDSNVIIEENGPVKTVIKAEGVLKNNTGETFLGYTIRMYFYRNSSKIKVVCTYKAGSKNLQENPEFKYVEIRLTPNLSNYHYLISTPDGKKTGSLTKTDILRMVLGRTKGHVKNSWWTLYGEQMIHRSESDISKYHGRGVFIYQVGSLIGYNLYLNGELIQHTDEDKFPSLFLMDVSDNDIGILAGIRFASGLWPKSLEFREGKLVIGLRPADNPKGYFMLFGSHNTTEILLDFHKKGIDAFKEMKKFQYPLIAKADINWYNSTGVFDYPLRFKLVTFDEEANFYKSLGLQVTGSRRTLSRKPGDFRNLRYWNWGEGGGHNQYDFALISLLNFLRENRLNYSSGYFLSSFDRIRYNADKAVFHSDDYDASINLCIPHGNKIACQDPQSVYLGHASTYLNNFNVGLPNADKVSSYKIVYEWEHVHWYAMPYYYYMTGDERIKEAINDFGEWYLAIKDKISLQYGRTIGNFLRSMAILYDFTKQEKYLNAAKEKALLFKKLQWGYMGFYWDRGMFVSKKGKENLISHTLAIYRYIYDGLYSLYSLPYLDSGFKDYLKDILEGLSRYYNREIWLGKGKFYAYDYYPNLGIRTNWEQKEWPNGYYCGTFAIVGGWEITGEEKFLDQMLNDLKLLDAGKTFGIYYYQDHPDLLTEIYILSHHQNCSLGNSSVNDLKAIYLGNGKVKLEWTSIGGHSYRIKFAKRKIVDDLFFDPSILKYKYDPKEYVAFWAAQNVLNEPKPKQKGKHESIIIEGLEKNTTYYFALRAEGMPGCVSNTSNIASIKVGPDGKDAADDANVQNDPSESKNEDKIDNDTESNSGSEKKDIDNQGLSDNQENSKEDTNNLSNNDNDNNSNIIDDDTDIDISNNTDIDTPNIDQDNIDGQDSSNLSKIEITELSDTTISGYSEKERTSNMGGEKWLRVWSNGVRRILIKPDLSQIPYGTKIVKAELKLYCYKLAWPKNPQLEVYRITKDWEEGTSKRGYTPDGATWYEISFYDHNSSTTNDWNSYGGDIDLETDFGFGPNGLVAKATYQEGEWVTIDITNLVQKWIDGELENYGLLIKGTKRGFNDAFFYSSESDNTELRPKLVIEYQY